MPVEQRILDEIALSGEEYRLIVQRLGREPNPLELGMFGALWSEHCGYKNSRLLLQELPTTGEHVLVGAGEENAGAVAIGEGLALVMKIESHNHPSAIEPYQGAATGVGGIVRDIFTMGARPIALLNSLRFGPLSEARNRYLFGGVVAGIASYGNCLGIPNVGGEVFFSEAYTHNPLVNALCLGLVESPKLVRARAGGVGNPLMLVGAETGRDGIHGASGLASRTDPSQRYEELRPAVQVGNPFLEKLLLEACLELAGSEALVGIQDLGAAGLTAAAVESAARAGCGVALDVLAVPRREGGMTPYEVMLSESQERMLVIVKAGTEEQVRAIFDKWELPATVIGRVSDDGLVRVYEGERLAAELPVALLTEPPRYRRQGVPPPELERLHAFDLASLPEPSDHNAVLLRLLASPNIASKEYVYRQYDHQVLTNTVLGPGADAAILRLKDSRQAIALTSDGNGRLCYLEPWVGGALAVAEAARNLVCVGAVPLALTDCLNFGNPERPEVYYQLEQCIRGMAEACRVLGTPVISGNVSLYNETAGQAVYPTPVVGMVGLIEDVAKICTPDFKDLGDAVLLLGLPPSGEATALAGSEYLERVQGLVAGQPSLDLELERLVQTCCHELIILGLAKSAHDCAEGGLAVALAEGCILGGMGLAAPQLTWGGRTDAALFGEQPSRIVVTVDPSFAARAMEIAWAHGIGAQLLGTVEGQRLVLGQAIDLPLTVLERIWRHALEEALEPASAGA